MADRTIGMSPRLSARGSRGVPSQFKFDVARFWSHVVKGPGERDCWLWTGAIADDGYGRFWLATAEGQRVVRPHRFAWALAAGAPLDEAEVVEHLRCDNPICVRADGSFRDHLAAGTQTVNLKRRAAHRTATRGVSRFGTGDRATLADRSRALRDAVSGGWDPERIRVALDSTQPSQLALW